MRLRPWQPLPGIRRYACLWARTTWRELLIYWREQLVTGLVIGVIAWIVSHHLAWRDLAVAALPSALVFLIVGIIAAIRAPIKIHNRQTQLLQRSKNLRARRASTSDAELQKARSQIRNLQEQLTTKSSRSTAEQYHYDQAQAKLSAPSKDSKILLRHIWDYEKVVAGPGLRVSGIDERQFQYLFAQLESTGLVEKRQEVGHRSYTIWWEVVPAYRTVLGELLYADRNSPTDQT